MSPRLKWIAIAGVLVFGLFQGCSNPTLNDEPRPNISSSDQLILGKKLDDPYTIESIKTALLSLINQNQNGLAKKSQKAMDSLEIKPNYLYVRFLPFGRVQEGKLQNHDTNLVMFRYPLDQEVIQEGHDPSLPDSVRAYYAAVPIGYQFCDSVEYEILKQLFLIEPVIDSLDSMVALGKRQSTPVDPFIAILSTYDITLQNLDMEALKLTGNLEARIKEMDTTGLSLAKKSAWFSSGFRPTGNVTYEDNILGKTPVVGARVTSGYWYTWTSVRTDAAGNFRSGSTYHWGVDYNLHFDADDFVFQKNGVINGPRGSKSAWNSYNKDKWGAVCACFAAAWNCYYGSIEGLSRPHQNKWYNVKLDLEIHDLEFVNNQAAYHTMFLFTFQSITVYLKSSETKTYITSREAFSNTTHELAHNAHYQNFETRHPAIPRDIEWSSYIESKVKETFAAGVEWRLMNLRYGARDRFYSYNGIYTGLVEDLMDNNTTYAQKFQTGVDLVQGFSLKQIENCVLKSFKYGEFTNKLKTTYPSGSSTGLNYTITNFDNLCNYWGNL